MAKVFSQSLNNYKEPGSNGVFVDCTKDVFQNYNKKRIVIRKKRVRTSKLK